MQARAKAALLVKPQLADLRELLAETDGLPAYIPEAATINTLVNKVRWAGAPGAPGGWGLGAGGEGWLGRGRSRKVAAAACSARLAQSCWLPGRAGPGWAGLG